MPVLMRLLRSAKSHHIKLADLRRRNSGIIALYSWCSHVSWGLGAMRRVRVAPWSDGVGDGGHLRGAATSTRGGVMSPVVDGVRGGVDCGWPLPRGACVA